VGYLFDAWSDGVDNQARTDANIHADLSVQATFVPSITLSGTIACSHAGNPIDVSGWLIGIFADPLDPDSILGACSISAEPYTWSATIPAMASATTVYFFLIDTANISGFYLDQTATASNADVSGIALSHATTSVSGTVANFTSPGTIIAELDTSSIERLNATLLGSTDNIDENGVWEMVLKANALPDDVYFIVIDGNSYFLANAGIEVPSAGLTGLVLDKDEFTAWTPSASTQPKTQVQNMSKAVKDFIRKR
jgi:hypothetical protein